ncbi:arsenite efflux transporter metallochaperone ArsD [Pelosinus sp. IPA-1]|uniref:arsenite efflux transporter metallochaperone ArsD n=1 Tax=Pelosinus sp. IPA-1 TaxID=3029569 RepID=UPI00243623E7|nr:arsenite efflux transporter metallochaperone ArsD [Pelosinus sp. IPA-1]GMA98308.1 hypothetical protein PIPA1_11080 [Pelosinus sp. IPA-1]
MKKIEVFEVALCCSTGVCGPVVNEDLLRITAVVNKINADGGKAVRYNLNSDPEMYIKNRVVNELLMKEGESILPITLVDGEVAKTGSYPSNSELADWSGLDLPYEAAAGSNCCCCDSSECCPIDQSCPIDGSCSEEDECCCKE